MVMISLGLGLSKSNMEQIEQYGGLTTITVYPNENGGGMNYGGGGMAMTAGSGSSGSAGNEMCIRDSHHPVRLRIKRQNP